MAALAAERDRFETALEGMPDAVIALGEDDRITAMNRAAQELLGTDESAQGQPIRRFAALAAITELVESRRAGELEVTLPPGGQRRLLATVTPQPTNVEGCVIVLRDVTELRRLENIRRDFVANVSHEIRTPLTVIQANTETLLSGVVEDPAHAGQFLDAVLRNSERLGRLVSDLLDISRIESGKYLLEPEDTPLAPLSRRVVEAFELEAEERDITLGLAVAADVRVWADPKALEQVVTNLVQNAVRYSDDGGDVELAADARGQVVRVEVRDNGPGIAIEHRSRVFERFYRVDSGRSRRTGGTGLGLAIVKHLVDAMGGRVGVEPRTPRGSVFWFTVPRAG
jgi:two-component system phosphate regulon sensor histidine kinase PhoR